MTDMRSLLIEEAQKHGDRLEMVSISRLAELQEELNEFKGSVELNGFQQWILNDLYHYTFPETGFEVKSIIIIALYHPFSADIELNYHGKIYHTKGLLHPDYDRTKKYLNDFIGENGFLIHEMWNLPIKRLAVQSGLAVYGRNNITYVEGWGSNVSYLAFLSDIPCETDAWREQCVAEICSSCNACIGHCPTGAIRSDRFLIDNQRCLSCMNEAGGDFPEWLPAEVHHTLYDCLRCQEKCPMNATAAKDVVGPIKFTHEETEMLLQGKRAEDFTKEFQDRTARLGLFDWVYGLSRNIKAIIDLADSNTF